MTRYLNLDFDFVDHPKVTRLEAVLGKGSGWLLIRLWSYCGKFHADDGILMGLSASDVESRSGWWGQPGKMIAAMTKEGFLEIKEGFYKVHDWEEHQGHLKALRDRGRKAAMARWDKLKGGEPCLGNANGLHKQCLRNASTGEEGKARDGDSKGEGDSAFPDSAEGLAQEFWFYQSPKKDNEFQLAQEFRSMISAGTSLDDLKSIVKAWIKAGDKSRFWWQVRKEFESKRSTEPRQSTMEELRERQRRNREDAERKCGPIKPSGGTGSHRRNSHESK